MAMTIAGIGQKKMELQNYTLLNLNL